MTSERDVLVKATPMRTLRAYMDEHLSAEVRTAILGKALVEFPADASSLAARPPVASERVRVVLVNRLIELTAEELREPATVLAHRLGRRAAEEASRGILRLAMILISMPSLLRKLGPVWAQLYTHGTVTSRSEGRTAIVELTDFPVKSQTGCARISGWFEWFAENGEKGATVAHSLCQTRDGGSLCRWDVKW